VFGACAVNSDGVRFVRGRYFDITKTGDGRLDEDVETGRVEDPVIRDGPSQ